MLYRSDAVVTGRATAGIKITQVSNLRFFAPQGRGRHDSRINVKFGTAEVRRAKFHFARRIFGDFRPKKYEHLPKNVQSCKRFRPAGANPSPDFSEIYVLYARNLSSVYATY